MTETIFENIDAKERCIKTGLESKLFRKYDFSSKEREEHDKRMEKLRKLPIEERVKAYEEEYRIYA
jgi:hypothetical protein